MNRFTVTRLQRALLAAALLASASGALAQATINHNKALAGNVTPGDAPGYPITISRPGHYKLVGNLSVPVGSDGIVITANDVTLDLNGFTVAGAGSCSRDNSTRVVSCSGGGHKGIAVSGSGGTLRNGTVRGFGWGISADAFGPSLIRMRATENSISGFQMNDPNGLRTAASVVESVADINGSYGAVLTSALVQGSRFESNGVAGLVGMGRRTVLQESYVTRNRQVGISNAAVRGSLTTNNGTDHSQVFSMGGNLSTAGAF